jgi:ATP-binding cassette subfamily B protein
MQENFIHFKNCHFTYPQTTKPVLQNFSLSITKGQKVGIVGSSGAGKSTLINLLLKNFAIDNYLYWQRSATEKASNQDAGGDIIINEQSIYDVSSDSLRQAISLIPQDIMLFHRSIGENIGYAKENCTQDEIENSAKLANIHDFIVNLPAGYATLVGERGIKLSGGQRQRIAIARAVLKNAPILVLDEATSSLDSQTENQIQQAISTMLENNSTTVIAIAHRLSTIKHLDRIIVIDAGKVVEDGSFAELIAKNGHFKDLWDHQVNGMLI